VIHICQAAYLGWLAGWLYHPWLLAPNGATAAVDAGTTSQRVAAAGPPAGRQEPQEAAAAARAGGAACAPGWWVPERGQRMRGGGRGRQGRRAGRQPGKRRGFGVQPGMNVCGAVQCSQAANKRKKSSVIVAGGLLCRVQWALLFPSAQPTSSPAAAMR
jgi:hypothetical protein